MPVASVKVTFNVDIPVKPVTLIPVAVKATVAPDSIVNSAFTTLPLGAAVSRV